jgi:hypothetical protein
LVLFIAFNALFDVHKFPATERKKGGKDMKRNAPLALMNRNRDNKESRSIKELRVIVHPSIRPPPIYPI